MSDLKKYISNRQQLDPEFSENYEGEGIKPLRLVLYSNKLTIWWHI